MTAIIHSPTYEGWVFDSSHPTQGRRFTKGFDLIEMNLDENLCAHSVLQPRPATFEELQRVHDPAYIARVSEGYSDEWSGQRLDLGELAALFAGGTLVALEALLSGQHDIAIHLPGAKHHAMFDRASGFCVFADFALAADIATEQGLKVAILDIDAHHGDGTETLTRHNQKVLTFSTHQQGIFPGTGLYDQPQFRVYNEPLDAETDGAGLLDAVERFLSVAHPHEPDLIFVAGGADGHWTDPLSSLMFDLEDYEGAMSMVRTQFPTTPILFGGAGGYRPDSATPLSWAAMIRGLTEWLN